MVGNNVFFWFTCIIDIDSFRNVNSIKTAFFISFIIYANIRVRILEGNICCLHEKQI